MAASLQKRVLSRYVNFFSAMSEVVRVCVSAMEIPLEPYMNLIGKVLSSSWENSRQSHIILIEC